MSTHIPFPPVTALGYPTVGRNLELKAALEAWWAGRGSARDLADTAASVCAQRIDTLTLLGLTENAAIPEDFSLYDPMWDTAITLGAIPDRFAPERDVLRRVGVAPEDDDALAESYRAQFAIARGEGERAALQMTKWFDSNYHYLVPEIGPDTPLEWFGSAQVARVAAAGSRVRPVIIGPVTFLTLARATDDAPEGFDPLDRLDDVLDLYEQWLRELGDAGAAWVQCDEHALVSDRWPQSPERLVAALRHSYARLAGVGPQVAVAFGYGDAHDAVDALADTSVQTVILDVVRGRLPDSSTLARWARTWAGRTIAAGVVSGRNVWRTDLDAAADTLTRLLDGLGEDVTVAVSTSTSLRHVPHTVAVEDRLDPVVRSWLAFADEKIAEVVALGRALREGREAVADVFGEAEAALASRARHPGTCRDEVRAAQARIAEADRVRVPYAERATAQRERLGVPVLPTTTIGSFPQTAEVRRARAAYRRGDLDRAAYVERMRAEIREVVALQEKIGLDVIVHGEAERNDMVQYFAEHLDGFVTTQHGWVQSYGSRCTRPSILWGDVARPAPITVEWSRFAASCTDKPVKGMLTGPVTIMAWSFVRDDVPASVVADQIGLALRDEVADLEAAGIGVIQVDEPAIRELLPLRKADTEDYVAWSVGAFRLATSGVRPHTQVHTHLCYSDFATVIDAVDFLDADVTSIEASRSKMDILPAVAEHGFRRELGPGVWDIHSPRVPEVAEIVALLRAAASAIAPERLWVNPDCGLKTRGYEETVASLRNLVEAARIVRNEVVAR